MTDDEQAPDWFFRLDPEVQAALIANPHGALPPGIVEKVLTHAHTAYWSGWQGSGPWQLWADDARGIEAEGRRREAAAADHDN